MKLHKALNTVTPLSKAIALFFFILFPLVGFYLGLISGEIIAISKFETIHNRVVYIRDIIIPTPIVSPTPIVRISPVFKKK